MASPAEGMHFNIRERVYEWNFFNFILIKARIIYTHIPFNIDVDMFSQYFDNSVLKKEKTK
jgi:hypothetical protein